MKNLRYDRKLPCLSACVCMCVCFLRNRITTSKLPTKQPMHYRLIVRCLRNYLCHLAQMDS